MNRYRKSFSFRVKIRFTRLGKTTEFDELLVKVAEAACGALGTALTIGIPFLGCIAGTIAGSMVGRLIVEKIHMIPMPHVSIKNSEKSEQRSEQRIRCAIWGTIRTKNKTLAAICLDKSVNGFRLASELLLDVDEKIEVKINDSYKTGRVAWARDGVYGIALS